MNFPDRAAELVPTDAESLRVEARLEFFKSHTSSRFRGVCWDAQAEKWLATIRYQNRVTKLGRFDAEVDAARAYDRASLRLRGQDGWFNFHPKTGEELRGKRVFLVDEESKRARSRSATSGAKRQRR